MRWAVAAGQGSKSAGPQQQSRGPPEGRKGRPRGDRPGAAQRGGLRLQDWPDVLSLCRSGRLLLSGRLLPLQSAGPVGMAGGAVGWRDPEVTWPTTHFDGRKSPRKAVTGPQPQEASRRNWARKRVCSLYPILSTAVCLPPRSAESTEMKEAGPCPAGPCPAGPSSSTFSILREGTFYLRHGGHTLPFRALSWRSHCVGAGHPVSQQVAVQQRAVWKEMGFHTVGPGSWW